jgi:hypothetical protein
LAPTFPLELVDVGNNTMQIPYLAALEFGENFTLLGLGQWYIIRTDYIGETTGVNSTTSPDGTTANVVSGRVPTFYSPETQREILIEVTFRCAVVNHRELYTIIIEPLPPVLSAAELETLIRITSLASVLTVSPAAAAAAALSLILQQIMLCRPLYENSGISLAGWSIGVGDPRYLRGALATNALVVLAEAVLVGLFAIVIIVYSKSRPNSIRFWRVMEMLQWPSVMHISISALLQLSTTASVSLISITATVEDGVLALAGLGFCLFYTIWICRQVYRIHRLTKESARKWDVAQGLGTSGFVFGDYLKPWFVGVETTCAFLIGVIAGVPPTLEICLIQIFCIFFISLFLVLMIAYHRPFKTIVGTVFAGLVHGLVCMAALALLIGRFTRNPKQPYTAATFLLMFIPVAALLRGSWDIIAVCRNARVWWERATTAECLQEMPWDLEKDEYEDAVSSEDEEMLNFGVAAPVKDAASLEAPLLAATASSTDSQKKKPATNKKKTATSSAAVAVNPEQSPLVDDDVSQFLATLEDKDTKQAATRSENQYIPPSAPPPWLLRGVCNFDFAQLSFLFRLSRRP